jgi:hypothetical protein
MHLGEDGIKFRGVAILGIVGFLLGAAGSYIYQQILVQKINVPLLIQQMFNTSWIQWGLVGALITIICGLAYVYHS